MPAGVIDQFVVELGLDPTKLKKAVASALEDLKKLGEGAHKMGQGVDKAGATGVASVAKLRGEVLSLFALFTAGRGIKDFITSQVSLNANLGRTAYTLDTSVRKLGAWIGAGASVGASAEEMTDTIQGLTSQFQMFSLTGESQVLPYFRALGVDISDGNGRMRDMGEVLLDLSDKFSKMDPARAKAFGDAMGISPGMLNLLIQGRKEVQAQLEMGKKYAPTQKDVDAAQHLQRSWNLLAMSSTAMGRQTLTNVAPWLDGMMVKLQELADWLVKNPPVLNLVMGTLVGLVGILSLPIASAFAGTIFGAATRGFAILARLLPTIFVGAAALTETTFPAIATGLLSIGIAIETLLGPLALATAAYFALGAAGQWAHDHLLSKGDRETVDAQVKRDIEAQRAAESGEGLPEWLGGKGKTKSVAPSGSPRAPAGPENDIDAFMRMGWTKDQAAGLVASINRESSGRENAIGDNGSAYGLAQWHSDRQAAFAAWAGHDIRQSTRAEQLAFIDHELRHGGEQAAGRALSQTTDARQAGTVVSSLYERPADKAGEASTRGELAQKLSANQAARASQVADAKAGAVSNNWASSNRHTDISIGELNVNAPQAQDAAGVAKGLPDAIKRTFVAEQANFGPV